MIEIYVLEGCPYCENTLKLLNNSHKRYKKIIVPYNKKDYYKQRHGMETFPQILIRTKDVYITLGGNSDIIKAFEIVEELKQTNMSNEGIYLFLEEFRK